MKMMKKIVALMMALAMVLAMGSFAVATEGSTEGDTQTQTQAASNVIGNGGTVEVANNSVSFINELTAFNPDEAEIYAPAVTYSFAIAKVADGNDGVGETVNDGTNTATVLSSISGTFNGVDYAVSGAPSITASVGYTTAEKITADDEGASNTLTVTASFANVEFPKAGIYRYKITRTVTDTNSMLTTQDDDADRYLDVYVKEENNQRSIYGYVLHHVDDDITTTTGKSDGYHDTYRTSNLTVSKTVVNDAMMNGHQFPFTVTFANTKKANILIEKTENANVAESLDTSVALVSNPTIAHGATVKYIGIPNRFTAAVYETNNVTGTTYNAVGTGDTPAAAKTIAQGDDSNTASTSAAEDATKVVGFTNTLSVISPTGYVARIAPYALMLAAGIVLLVLFVKRRKPATEDDE